MATKKIQMIPEGTDDYGTTLHPETSADMVLMSGGKTVEQSINEHLADNVSQGVHGMGSIASLDYEEGTFTPYLSYMGGTTFSEQTGHYVKKGNEIFVSVRLTIDEKDDSATGQVHLQGLPFNPNTSRVSGQSYVHHQHIDATGDSLSVSSSLNGFYFYVNKFGSSQSTLLRTSLKDGSSFSFNRTYFI